MNVFFFAPLLLPCTILNARPGTCTRNKAIRTPSEVDLEVLSTRKEAMQKAELFL